MDVLAAIQTLRKIWQNLPPDIIENFWKHTKVSPATAQFISPLKIPQEKLERNALQEQISALVSVRARMSVDNFINASGEEECVEEFDEEHALFGDMEDDLEGSRSADGITSDATQEEEIPPRPCESN